MPGYSTMPTIGGRDPWIMPPATPTGPTALAPPAIGGRDPRTLFAITGFAPPPMPSFPVTGAPSGWPPAALGGRDPRAANPYAAGMATRSPWQADWLARRFPGGFPGQGWGVGGTPRTGAESPFAAYLRTRGQNPYGGW